jgi:hypothetical protein
MGLFGDNNRVEGNFIGTDPTGTLDRGNFIGVELFGALDNTVGGTTPAARNVISGNEGFGVRIAGNPTFGNASGNRVQNNHIGTTKGGTAPLNNAFHGVEIFGSHAMNNTVGGVEAGAGNVIAFNGSDGVAVSTFPDGGVPVGNDVLSNSVHSNGGLGIDLGDDGPTASDPGDADSGPNLSQNFPEITSAKPIQRKKKKLTAIAGTLDSSAGGAFTVQVFSNPPGGDEGKRLVRTLADVRTNAEGSASFGFKVARSAAPAGSTITATATDSGGNTSELSPARTVR